MENKSVQYIKGVGPKRAEIFRRLDIETVEDILCYFPRDWQDRRLSNLISLFRQNGTTILKGKVLSSGVIRRGKLHIFKAIIKTSEGREIQAHWFKRPARGYDVFSTLNKDVKHNAEIWIVGHGDAASSINVDEYYPAAPPAEEMHINRIIPVYPLVSGITAKFMRETVYRALSETAQIKDILPLSLSKKYGFLSRAQALRGYHFPDSMEELNCAKERIIYEEFLLLAAAWELKKRQSKKTIKAQRYEIKRTLLTPFKEQMGFEFTTAQKRVINEIFKDMTSPYPMARLLQGDVGSGKTVAALSAILLAAENGFQSAFMAPTEILAEQHFFTLKKFLKNLPVKFEILTSRVPKKKRQDILSALASGKIDIIVGTHALIEEDVKFKNLSLAVIDEQHRFGVEQRAKLRAKSGNADTLIMTATPIPRTLSLVLYGDLDVSIIDELPPGRIPIETVALDERAALNLARGEIKKGRQVYIVHPLIEESEKLDIKAAEEGFKEMQKVFGGSAVAMLHGKMPPSKKSEVMEKFAEGKISVLCATSVIEVGIDVKNASVMIIRDAHRFGLASLHQLRGRVGRGVNESFCVLVSDVKSGDAKQRIDFLCSSSDGFAVGEKDMELRGPGEVMGTRQHGRFELGAGDIVRDKKLLACAIEDKNEILTRDPDLMRPEHFLFRRELIKLYSQKWRLIDLP